MVQFEYPTDVCFDCSKCGLCCGDTSQKVRRVLMLMSDVEKILDNAGQPMSHFAIKVHGNEPYIYEMRKNPVDGKCVFLKDNQCTIYEFRPLICRFYPVELKTDESEKIVFRVTSECPSVCFKCAIGDKKLGKNYFQQLLELARAEFDNASIP